MRMSDDQRLSQEVKTNVTKATEAELEAIAGARGEGVKVTQLLREAIRDFIAKHKAQEKK